MCFVTAYFIVLMCFLTGHVKVPGEFHDMVQTLIGILTGALGTIMSFWFSRQRISADDPSAPGTITSTSTTTKTP